MSSFAEEIKRIRKEKGLTQVQLAQKSGVSQGYITHLETGRNTGLHVETLFALCRALGVPCTDFERFFPIDATGSAKPLKPKSKKKPRPS